MPEGQQSGGELSKVMAVLLAVQGSYTHVDKLSQASSKDLALYYAKEALRDYNSLLSSGKFNAIGMRRLIRESEDADREPKEIAAREHEKLSAYADELLRRALATEVVRSE